MPEKLTAGQEARECAHPAEHVTPAFLRTDYGHVIGVSGCCMVCTATVPLAMDKTIRCSSVVGNGERLDWGGEEADECGQPSGFVVARGDGDESYGINGGSDECCEAHLADTVCGMAEGTDMPIVVGVRWNYGPPLDEVPPGRDRYRWASAAAGLNEHGVTVSPFASLTADRLEAMAAILCPADEAAGESR